MSRNLMPCIVIVAGMVLPAWSLLPGGGGDFIRLGASPSRSTSEFVAARAAVIDTVRTYETEHFFLVYSIEGVHKMVLSDGNISPSARPNIEIIGEFAEKSWHLALDTMGYRTPPLNAETTWYYRKPIPKGKLPIEIVDMGSVDVSFKGQPYMGYSISPTTANGGLAEILIENDFLYDSAGIKKPIRIFKNPSVPGGDSLLADYSQVTYMWDGWYTAVSHELYHCVQMSYEYSYLYAFHEMTASWFAMRATKSFGAVHHWGSNQEFLKQMNGGVFAQGDIANANGIFIRALAKYAGEDFIRKLWEDRSKNVTQAALYPDRTWFRRAVDSLGLNLTGFLDYYASEVGCMYTNSKCDLNDWGAFRAVLPSINYINLAIKDSTLEQLVIPLNGWGGDKEGLGPLNLSSGYSRFRIEKVRDTVVESGFVLHLPSKTYNAFSFRNGPAVIEKRSDDTLLVFWGFTAGGVGSGLVVYPTNAPVTPSGVSRKIVSVPAVRARYDLRGRPVPFKGRGLIFEKLDNGRIRSVVDLTK